MTFMPRNDEGEVELVVGMKQFLSVSFIVVILIGVCFATGYIVGRTRTPVDGATVPGRTSPQAASVPARVPVPSPVSAHAEVPEPKKAGGTYLQVAAGIRPEAELLASRLRKKGFPQAVVVPGPTDAIFRVVVGPIPDRGALARTKSDLAAAGFESLIRKY